ncbi:Hypothetical predicted protein [Podarcis lilfordi]|uniref:Uncharacterized protein n=1 Tax=Podarcis lilfordi TaxID=74358 RepID=A0AA35KVK8_9SAUR|nr:Hypothetical predicted protein [Podarcis lilfordi]
MKQLELLLEKVNSNSVFPAPLPSSNRPLRRVPVVAPGTPSPLHLTPASGRRSWHGQWGLEPRCWVRGNEDGAEAALPGYPALEQRGFLKLASNAILLCQLPRDTPCPTPPSGRRLCKASGGRRLLSCPS